MIIYFNYNYLFFALLLLDKVEEEEEYILLILKFSLVNELSKSNSIFSILSSCSFLLLVSFFDFDVNFVVVVELVVTE